jgi:hypothetical protein
MSGDRADKKTQSKTTQSDNAVQERAAQGI